MLNKFLCLGARPQGLLPSLPMNFSKSFLIAEIGINHNGDMKLAKKMIAKAASAGADAVKFQNYKTEDFIADRNLMYTYTSQGREVTESQYCMFKRCELDLNDLYELKSACDENGVQFLSTPTSDLGIKELVEVGSSWIKNGSDYLGHLPLIKSMALTGLPTILSTGMATESEIDDAVEAFRNAGGKDLILLACTSSYPTPPEHLNLKRISGLAKKYSCPSGFSDHSAGWQAAVSAVSLGACVIEKHFTTDRNLDGPDHWFSSTPQEFAELVTRIREAEKMLGSSVLKPTDAERHSRQQFRLSCTASRDLEKGILLSTNDICFRRPANGLAPKFANLIVGKVVKNFIKEGKSLDFSDFEK